MLHVSNDVVVDDDNNFDVINRLAEEMGVTGTVWNSWQNSWFGERQWTGTQSSTSTQRINTGGGIATIRTTTTRAVGTQQVGQTRSGIETSIQSSVDSHNMGDRIVGINMIPFMRSRNLLVFLLQICVLTQRCLHSLITKM